MQVSHNPISNSTQLTVDGHELSLLQKAVWDEQMLYYSLIRERKYCTPTQKQEWLERLEQLNIMAEVIGAGVIVAPQEVVDVRR